MAAITAGLSPLLRTLLACLCVLMAPITAQAQNYSDIWWNPAESGWGLTIADHQSQLFAVWFTYRQDGSPTWYVIPGGTFSNNRQRFQGDIYATSGPSYSAATFDPAQVTATKVGTTTIDFTSSGAGTFTYSLEGVTQTKPIQRQPFGNAAPAWGSDFTDIWWNPAESGWGLTLAQHGNDVFGVWFTYDTGGRPLWVVIPGVTFSGGSSFTGSMFTTTGPYFATVPFDSSRVVVTPAGTATVTLTQANANPQCGGTQSASFQPSFRGTSRLMNSCHQPFGDTPGGTPPPPALPVLPAFPDAPGLLEGAALFLAPPDPVNVTVTTDASRSLKQVITPSGGTASLTDARGNRYTLAFPAGAVTEDTLITMTPIATLSGVSYASGVVAGLRLEPIGLVLQESAVLTIVPGRSFPMREQTPFGAADGGRDLSYALPGTDYSRIQLIVPHFSFWGWLLMTPAERTNQMRMKLAADHEKRLMHWLAAYGGATRQLAVVGSLPDPDLEKPPSIDQVKAWIDAYYDLVIRPRLLAATGSCVNAMAALDAVTTLRGMLRIWGFPAPAAFFDDVETIRRAFVALKGACRLEQENTTLKGSTFTATINAVWNIAEVSGNVYTYRPARGTISLTIPDRPRCTISDPSVDIDTRLDNYLRIDWDAKTYRGMAVQYLTVRVSCREGEVQDIPFPVTYLGISSEATGPVNDDRAQYGLIAPKTITVGGNTLTYQFDRCGAYTVMFCGRPPPEAF